MVNIRGGLGVVTNTEYFPNVLWPRSNVFACCAAATPPFDINLIISLYIVAVFK